MHAPKKKMKVVSPCNSEYVVSIDKYVICKSCPKGLRFLLETYPHFDC